MALELKKKNNNNRNDLSKNRKPFEKDVHTQT